MDKTEQILQPALKWFATNDWSPAPFQHRSWRCYLNGQSALINAPTGSGKTYAALLGPLVDHLFHHPNAKPAGLQLIWISPIRALTKEIYQSTKRAIQALFPEEQQWTVGIRTGDTKSNERAKQKKSPPNILITTPESLHVLLASSGYINLFSSVKLVVADEWHELVGSKRGVQVQLFLSRLQAITQDKLRVWGISATIGNMDVAEQVLFGSKHQNFQRIVARIKKEIEVHSILPDHIDELPWAGHLGIKLLEKVLPLIHQSRSVLIFTNTRAQCEIWYQRLLEAEPELAGLMAMHHASISRELRNWVEEALHTGALKAVVCTSSLDLGVDFRPVETIIQIGSPRGVGRFVQRAGRSGHLPGATSSIYFVPTHSLELIEAAGLRDAIQKGIIEERIPHIRSFDVLIQYLVTLAVSDGFQPNQIFEEIQQTFAYQHINREEFNWAIDFLISGGSLQAYDEFHKAHYLPDGRLVVTRKDIARRHRLSIGTIVSDQSLFVQYVSGKKLGNIEEWFIAQMSPGDSFWFAGKSLELVRIRHNIVYVRKSGKKKGKVPSWMGGRLPISASLASSLREQLSYINAGELHSMELKALRPLLEQQETLSAIPANHQLLIEQFQSQEGHHVIIYPFEGRNVHQGMAALIGHRLSKIRPMSISMAMNDYGFELLSDDPIPLKEALDRDLFTTENLFEDIQQSLNEVEMARRQFRDIASIAGLLFRGFPGKAKKERHLQSSSGLLFQVFQDYEPDNKLFLQAFEEVRFFMLEETRLRQALGAISKKTIIVHSPRNPTPFAFPIMVDRLRERMSSERLEDRIKKMRLQFR